MINDDNLRRYALNNFGLAEHVCDIPSHLQMHRGNNREP